MTRTHQGLLMLGIGISLAVLLGWFAFYTQSQIGNALTQG